MTQNDPGLLELDAFKFTSGTISKSRETVVEEEPMEIILSDPEVNDHPYSVTMRTPGMDLELAIGYIFSEGLMSSMADVLSMRQGSWSDPAERNRVFVKLRRSTLNERGMKEKKVNSSCGICSKSSVDEVFLKAGSINRSHLSVRHSVLLSLPSIMLEKQVLFRKTGGIHAAALFKSDGSLAGIAEDVGRHNAVDKVIGSHLLKDGENFGDCILQVSGRCGFEILQKAAIAGIPIVSSVSAPTSLSVETARALGMTLISFVRSERFTIYSGEWRIS
jgi:FdhD protein